MLSPFHFNRLVRADIGEAPALSFTFGAIAHILTVSMTRRQTVMDVLHEIGVSDVERRDPIEWERLIESGR